MYRSPRLVDVPVVVELPTTMYKAPVLNGLGGVELGASCYRGHGPCKSYPEATALEARQEAVLARLQTLKEKLDHLQSTRTTATGAAPPTLGAAAISSPNKGTVHDLVVAASPATPPLSLLLLRRLLAQAGRPVHCTSRLHSSVAKVDPKLHAAFTAAPLGDRGNHSLAFSLQWTDTPTPSLMVNPLRQTRIEGEANLIRYISRLFPSTSSLNYEAVGSYSTIAEVDTLLDSLEARLSNGSGKGRGGRGGSGRDGGVMKEIVERLSKQPYLLGNT